MFMTKEDYDHLFRQLCNLKMEAPYGNGRCVGYQNCEYGVYEAYGEKCAIDIVEDEAARRYKEEFI